MFELCVRSLAWGLDTSLKAALVALAAAALLKLLRFHDSNLRHRAWTGVLAGMLLLPVLTPLMPALRLPLLPSPDWLLAWTADPAAAAATAEAAPDQVAPADPWVFPAALAGAELQPSRARSQLDDAWQLPPGDFPPSAAPPPEITSALIPSPAIEAAKERSESPLVPASPTPRADYARHTAATLLMIAAG